MIPRVVRSNSELIGGTVSGIPIAYETDSEIQEQGRRKRVVVVHRLVMLQMF